VVHGACMLRCYATPKVPVVKVGTFLQKEGRFDQLAKKYGILDFCHIVSNHRLRVLVKSAEATVDRACPAAWRRTEQDIDEEQLLVDVFKTVLDRWYKQPLSYPLINKRSTSNIALVSQISGLTGIEAAKLFAAIEAIMRILSKFRDPRRIMQAIRHYIKEHPWQAAFHIICIILILNPVLLFGFGSGGVIGGKMLFYEQ